MEDTDLEQADTEQAGTEPTVEVVGSRRIFTILIAVSGLLAVLFLLSLLVIVALCLCVLRLNKQMDSMKGMHHAILKFDCHYCSWGPECVLGPVLCVRCTTLAGDEFFYIVTVISFVVLILCTQVCLGVTFMCSGQGVKIHPEISLIACILLRRIMFPHGFCIQLND